MLYQRKLSIVLAAAFVALVGCSSAVNEAPIRDESKLSRAYHGGKYLASHGVALEGYCPVAYFAVNKPVRGQKEHTANYDGATYYFVNAEAQDAFVRNPTKYIPAYGGWCAYGMAKSDKFPVDPTNFAIIDGRLMLFLRNDAVDALALWKQEPEDKLIDEADKHWAKVQG